MDVNNGTSFGEIKVVALKGEKGDMGDAGDYAGLANKPSINGVTLNGNKSDTQLGLASQAEVDQLISQVGTGGVTTLFTGSLKDPEDSAVLSQSIVNFDFIDIYYDCNGLNHIRVPKSRLSGGTGTVMLNGALVGNTDYPYQKEYRTIISFNGTAVSISSTSAWEWDGIASNNASEASIETGYLDVWRIDGITLTGTDSAELENIRIGADGTTYPSAGDAVRGQITDLKEDINFVESAFNMPPNVLVFDLAHYCNTSGIDIAQYYEDGFDFNNTTPGGLESVMFVFPTVQGQTYKIEFTINEGTFTSGGIKNNPNPGTKPSYVPTAASLVSFGSARKYSFVATGSESLLFFTVPEGMFSIRNAVCYSLSENIVVKETSLPPEIQIIEPLNLEVGKKVVLVDNSSDFIVEDKAILPDGTRVTDTLRTLTDYIPLKGCTSLLYKLYDNRPSPDLSYNVISFYDENKDYISGIWSRGNSVEESIVGVPTNAEYVVGSWLSISTATPYIIGVIDDGLCSKVDGLEGNDELNETATLSVVNSSMTLYQFKDAINAYWTTYATLCRCRPWSFMYLKQANVNQLITINDYINFCEVLNKNFRREVANPKYSFAENCNRINNAFTKPIYRFIDAKLNTTNQIDFSLKTPLVDKSEPSVIVSKDLSTMYVYAFMKRVSTQDGVVWSEQESVHYDGVTLIHANISLVGDTYFMTGTNGNDNRLFSMKTSSDGLNFTTVGNLFPLNYEIESGEPVIAYGNSTIMKEYGSDKYYLYVEYLTNVAEGWKIALFTGDNPYQTNQDGTVGDWVSDSGNPVIKQVWENLDGTDDVGACNPDFIKGADNRPLKHDDKYYMMIHSVHNHYSYNVLGTANLIRLVSTDLKTWTTDGILLDNRDIPQQGDDTCGNSDACIIEFKGRTYLFYSKDVNNTQQSVIHETVVYMVDDRPLEEMIKIRP